MRRGRGLLIGLAWVVAGFLLLPGLVAIPVSFSDTPYLSLPKEGLSLRHYQTLLGLAEWRASAWQSAVVAVITTVLATILGTACAIGLWRLAGRSVATVGMIILFPMILPPIVSALAMYRLWVAVGLYDTVAGVVVAHVILAAPFVLITVTASLARVDPRLEQASRSLGAGLARTAWRVILPSIRPGVATGAVFAFIISWDEIVVTLFVAGRGVYTLPRRMWDGIRENVDPTVAAVATVLIGLTALVIAVALLIDRRRGLAE